MTATNRTPIQAKVRPQVRPGRGGRRYAVALLTLGLLMTAGASAQDSGRDRARRTRLGGERQPYVVTYTPGGYAPYGYSYCRLCYYHPHSYYDHRPYGSRGRTPMRWDPQMGRFPAARQQSAQTGAAKGKQPEGGGPLFGGPADVGYAESLWKTALSGYRNWQSYPGLDGFQPGKSPHGKFLKYFINATTAERPQDPGYGSIILKENYTDQDPNTLAAVTIMQKIPRYDPDAADWFWVKFAPDGTVMSNPKGIKLAGRVAKGMPKGCIACHSNAGGDDYLFIND